MLHVRQFVTGFEQLWISGEQHQFRLHDAGLFQQYTISFQLPYPQFGFGFHFDPCEFLWDADFQIWSSGNGFDLSLKFDHTRIFRQHIDEAAGEFRDQSRAYSRSEDQQLLQYDRDRLRQEVLILTVRPLVESVK